MDPQDPRSPDPGPPPWGRPRPGTHGTPEPTTYGVASHDRAADPTTPRRRKKPLWALLGVVAGLIALGNACGPEGGPTDGSDPAGITASASPASQVPAASAPGPTAAGIGDTVRSADLEFTVTAVEPGLPSMGEGFLRAEAQGEFVVVRVGVRNVGGESAMLSDSNQILIDAEGREFEASTGAAVMSLPDSEAFLNRINPGNAVDGALLFDVPAGLRPAAIELRGSLFSQPATVALS